jgi:bifunctional non-homologous end joining protein LigD
VPVRWDELAHLTSGAHWSVATVQSRLAEGNEPWSGYEAARNALAAAMKTLDFKAG